MVYYVSNEDRGSYIAHSRTKGSKNGIRLYQYLDGSLTPLGREHYGVGPPRGSKEYETNKNEKRAFKRAAKDRDKHDKAVNSGDAKRLSKSLHLLSDSDVKEAIKRIGLRANISKAESARKLKEAQLTEKETKELQKIADQKAAREKEAREKPIRKDAVNSGDLKAVKDNIKLLSDQDIEKALKRVDATVTIDDMLKERARQLKRGSQQSEELERVIGRGNPREIRMRMSELTTGEIKRALTRAELNTKLKDLYKPKSQGGTLDKIMKVANTVGTVADNIGKVKRLLNSGDSKKKDKKNSNQEDELTKALNALTKELSAKTDGAKSNSIAERTAALNGKIADMNNSVKQRNQEKAAENREKQQNQQSQEQNSEKKKKKLFGNKQQDTQENDSSKSEQQSQPSYKTLLDELSKQNQDAAKSLFSPENRDRASKYSSYLDELSSAREKQVNDTAKSLFSTENRDRASKYASYKDELANAKEKLFRDVAKEASNTESTRRIMEQLRANDDKILSSWSTSSSSSKKPLGQRAESSSERDQELRAARRKKRRH